MDLKISVIVPAYNAEKTIERCLSSITNQTYQCLDLIVVNDGSTDNTKSLVDKIAKSDDRVRLINIDNGGVSHARNIGIEHAKGDYITFVDADDYIDNIMYEQLINLIKKYDVKISHCSYVNDDEDGNLISIVGDNGKQVIQDHDEAIACLLDGRLFSGGLWNKLYNKSLFSECRLDEKIKHNEDILLNFQLFDQVDSSVYIDAPLYHYVADSTSSTHSANGLEARKQWVYVSRKILELSKNKSYEKNAERKYAYNLLGLYREYIFENNKSNKQEIVAIRNEIDEYRKKGYLLSRKDRLQYFMYKYLPHIFVFSYSFYDKIRVKKLDPEQTYE